MNQQTFLFTTPAPLTVATLREIGNAKKQRGMALAAEARAEAVAAGQVALLRALMASDDGTATIDDATDDLTHRFVGGGKWRGTVTSALSRRGIIERIGDRKSDRPTRHRGYVSLWRLKDRNKARQEIERLTAWLSAVEKENPQSAATDAGDLNGNHKTQTDKELSNEII
jgi:hypothetical protein